MSGFTFTTTLAVTYAKDLFTTFGGPIIAISGGVSLFGGLLLTVVTAIRAAWR